MASPSLFATVRLTALAAVLAACSRHPAPAAPAPASAPAPAMAAPAPQPAPTPVAPAPAPAAAPAPAPAGSADVSGDWSFSLDIQGQAVTGSMTLTRSGAAWTGQVSPDGMSAAPVRTVVIAGTRITITVDAPDGEAVVEGALSNGNRTISGTLNYNGSAGSFTATKR